MGQVDEQALTQTWKGQPYGGRRCCSVCGEMRACKGTGPHKQKCFACYLAFKAKVRAKAVRPGG